MADSTDGKMSSRAPDPVGAYPHARSAGSFLFLSGIGPRRPGTDEIPGLVLDDAGKVAGRDIEAECRSVFDNVRAVLEDAGSGWDRIVDVTVFLTHMEEDFETYNRVYAEYFGEVRPTRTTLEILSLPTPISIELKVIATLD